jgi:hypothetical protein
VTKGTIKIIGANSNDMTVKIHYRKKRQKKQLDIQDDFVVSGELHGKECTFKRNEQEIVEIIVDGKALEKKEKIVKKPQYEKQSQHGSIGKYGPIRVSSV